MSTLHRRDWLKQGSLALASLGLLSRLKGFSGEQPFRTKAEGPIRLTSNENPYGPSPLARKAMAEAIGRSNRYPWDFTTALREKIGSLHGLSAQHVLMGAGSSEILGLAAQLAAMKKGNAITADPSFSIWVPAAEKMGLKVIRVPLTADKKHDLSAMLSKLISDTRLFYICNPNNPTGTILPAAEIEAVVAEASKTALVVLDEAYIEYGEAASLSGLVAANPNVIVAKTFSKIHGLAGARIGYALAHPDRIRQLGAFQPWNNAGASAVSLAGAMASLDDRDYLASCKERNAAARSFTEKQLAALGFRVIPSYTNFIYYSLGNYTGNWQEEMKSKQILVGRISENEGRWTRITVGNLAEMKRFIEVAETLV